MYTKHYYNGSSRIASRIGGGFNQHNDLNNYSPALDHVQLQNGNDYTNKAQQLRNVWSRNASCAGLDQNLEYAYSLELNPLFANSQPDGARYFYHSDHLGSSAYITTKMRSIREDLWKTTWTEQNGYATQFLAYMPFGETLSEQQNSTSYYLPFKFSAKEKDLETGYSYFGARYYSPELSVWLSVDPLSDKYPSLSPYNYCALNPVTLVDPDGRYFISHSKKYGNRTRYTAHATNPVWIKQVDNMSAIPVLGTVFDMAKIGATWQDPSFNLSNSDKGGLAFDIITSFSLGIIKKSTDLAGLGLKILEGSREISSATLSLLGNSETFEVGLDNLTFQAMDELGLGNFYKDETGEQMTNQFIFNDSVIQNIEAGIRKENKLASQPGFDMQKAVESKLSEIIMSVKESIRTSINKEQ